MNVEARPLDAGMVTRRCVLAKLCELTVEKYKDLLAQTAGGLLVLLPQNLSSLSDKDQEVRCKAFII